MQSINNVRLPCPRNELTSGQLWRIEVDRQGIIRSICPEDLKPQSNQISWFGDWISPMGLDLQINGGLGISFNKLSLKDIPKLFSLLDKLWIDGVEAICPTLITCEIKQLRTSLEVLGHARSNHSEDRCQLLGAHIEGPFLNSEYKGAHPLGNICRPSVSELKKRIKDYEEDIDLFTIAPELPGAEEIISYLKKIGVIVCLGHSGADSREAQKAFDRGIKMLTHTFNAMPGLHHREPGPIGEALLNGRVAMGLIADGIHIHPNIVAIIQKIAAEQLVLVSDVVSPYGLLEGLHKWDERQIFVKNCQCRLQDGTLAGSTLSLLEGCKNLAEWTGQASSAIWSATVAPRKILYESQDLHQFLIGKPLKRLLRWKLDENSNSLSWQKAA